MTRQFFVELLQGFAVAAVIGAILLLASIASAQEDEATVLILAQAMVAEADWDSADDHAALAFALQRVASIRHVRLRDHALDYVAAFDSRNHRPRATWIRCLNLEALKPDGWPMDAAWSPFVDKWLKVIERARAFLRGELRDPCPGSHDWGGGMDDPPDGLVPVKCIKTAKLANTFYRRAR